MNDQKKRADEIIGMHKKYEEIDELNGGPSRRWIAGFAERIGHDYETIMAAAAKYLATGEDFGLGLNVDEEEAGFKDFWYHYWKAVNRKPNRRKQKNFFYCACY